MLSTKILSHQTKNNNDLMQGSRRDNIDSVESSPDEVLPMDGSSNIMLPRSIRWRIQFGILNVPPQQDWTLDDLEIYNRDAVRSQRLMYSTLIENYRSDYEASCRHCNEKSKSKNSKSSSPPVCEEVEIPNFHDSIASLEPCEMFNECLDSRNRANSIDTTEPVDEELLLAEIEEEDKDVDKEYKEEDDAEDDMDEPSELLNACIESSKPQADSRTSDFGKEEDSDEETDIPQELSTECIGARVSVSLDSISEEDKESEEINSCSETMESQLEEPLELILKDLKRLPSEHEDVYTANIRRRSSMNHNEKSRKNRCDQLKEMLYIFCREHGEYLQGYHELASLLLMVLEIDVYQNHQSILLDRRYLPHDTFAMIQRLIPRLYPLYSGEKMDVKSKLRFASGDDKSRKHLISSMEVTPELFYARWTRLLFCREVANWKTWLPLMDIFMDLTAYERSILSSDNIPLYRMSGILSTVVSSNMEWMELLETTAASLIWVNRRELVTSDRSQELYMMLSLKPLTCVKGLISTLLSFLHRQSQDTISDKINDGIGMLATNIHKSVSNVKRRLSMDNRYTPPAVEPSLGRSPIQKRATMSFSSDSPPIEAESTPRRMSRRATMSFSTDIKVPERDPSSPRPPRPLQREAEPISRRMSRRRATMSFSSRAVESEQTWPSPTERITARSISTDCIPISRKITKRRATMSFSTGAPKPEPTLPRPLSRSTSSSSDDCISLKSGMRTPRRTSRRRASLR